MSNYAVIPLKQAFEQNVYDINSNRFELHRVTGIGVRVYEKDSPLDRNVLASRVDLSNGVTLAYAFISEPA